MISGGASGFLAISIPRQILDINPGYVPRNAAVRTIFTNSGWRTRRSRHLYSWNWFDASLLIPYFRGDDRACLLRHASLPACVALLQARKNATRRAAAAISPNCRVITVQLPIFNEQFVIDRLIEAVLPPGLSARPPGNPGARRLDRRDAGRWPRRSWSAIARLHGEPQPIVYIHRTNRHGYKAGALEHGLKTANGRAHRHLRR